MLGVRVTSRLSRNVAAQCRSSSVLYARRNQHHLPILCNQFHAVSLIESPNKMATGQTFMLHDSFLCTSTLQRFGFSSTASPQRTEKENDDPAAKTSGLMDPSEESSPEDAKTLEQEKEPGSNPNASQSVKRRRIPHKRTAFSDSDSDSEADVSRDDLVRIAAEKEELLKVKQKEIEQMKDKVLRTYADMENVMDRTRREAENSKKFAVQNFAKSLLDVADNLGRASSAAKNSYSKIDASKDTVGAVPLLKTLLEGVEMTEKQLGEVFKKFGVEKYEPTNEQFDPHRHNAVFQVPDPSKPPGTVAVVLKSGYMLHDRIIRPAEVGVTDAVENKEGE